MLTYNNVEMVKINKYVEDYDYKVLELRSW